MADQDTVEEDIGNRVLILEDSVLHGVTLMMNLKSAGYCVDLATCIAEAQEYIARAHQTGNYYFAAILDMGVPLEKGMIIDSYAGFDYAQELRQSDPGIRIAICTSQELLENQIKTLSAQGIIHIDKMRGHDTIIKFLKS